MKKIIPILCFAVMLLLVGCSNPALKVKEASDKMEKLDSYGIKFSFEIAGEENGEKQSTTIAMEGKYDMKNKTSYITANFMGMSFETYTKEESNNVVTYSENIFNENEGWVKSVVPKEDEPSVVDTKEFLALIDKASKIKEVSSDVSGMTKYQLTLTVDDFKDIMNAAGETLGDEEVGLKSDGEADINIYVTNDGYVGKMVIDMAGLISDEAEIKFTKLAFSVEFYDFNKAEVIIPANIIDNAVEDYSFELE